LGVRSQSRDECQKDGDSNVLFHDFFPHGGWN
jgi:hypothetical protein